MKIILLSSSVLLATTLAGCLPDDQTRAAFAEEQAQAAQVICLGGVQYWYIFGMRRVALAPKFNRDGSLNGCQ